MAAVLFKRLGLIISLTLVLLLGTIPTSQAATRGGLKLQAIGRPIWKPVDCHLFSAPIGTAATGYAEYLDTTASILPAPNHVRHPVLGIGPGAAHRPPYNSELDEGIAAQGFHEGRRFSSTEFSNGSGVLLACMVVPKPGTRGSSPDFSSGRIIPNRLFPIDVIGVAYRNHRPFDPNFINYQVPPLTTELGPLFDVDGHSHFPLFVTTNQDFAIPPVVDLRGRYLYDLTLTDAAGKGWRLQADFVIAS